jgi:Thymidine kinase
MTHAAVSTTHLYDIKPSQLDGVDVIGIDEGQFYPDLIAFCEDMADEGKHVIVAALDGTYQRKPFGKVLDLIPLAEKVSKLNAVCMVCQSTASFTSRLGSETAVELIGGTDRYISTCRKCFKAKLHLQHTPGRAPAREKKAQDCNSDSPAHRNLAGSTSENDTSFSSPVSSPTSSIALLNSSPTVGAAPTPLIPL